MNPNSKHIKDLVSKALDSVDYKFGFVPIENIAIKFGLDVVEFPFHDEISGLLKRDQGVIGVNKSQAPVRRRFTIAHELGHFLLGHSLDRDDEIIDDSFNKPYPQEREANVFASFILMPEDSVKQSVKEKDLDLDIDILSKEFGVSKQAMTIRLLELNLIK